MQIVARRWRGETPHGKLCPPHVDRSLAGAFPNRALVALFAFAFAFAGVALAEDAVRGSGNVVA